MIYTNQSTEALSVEIEAKTGFVKILYKNIKGVLYEQLHTHTHTH